MSADLSGLVARFQALTAHPPLPIDQMMVYTGQLAQEVARSTNTSARLTRTETGVSVRFVGPRAQTAYQLMRRRLGSITGEIIAAATNTILEELTR